MAKNMARLQNGVIRNVLWCSDAQKETDTLKNFGEYRLQIGDTYSDGKWYRDGELLLTPYEQAQAELESMTSERDELLDEMASMIEEIYQEDLGLIDE